MRDDENTPTSFVRETNGGGDPSLSSGAASARIATLTRASEKLKKEIDTLDSKMDEMLLGLTMLERRFGHMQKAVEGVGSRVLGLAVVSGASLFAGSFAGSFVASLLWHWLNK